MAKKSVTANSKNPARCPHEELSFVDGSKWSGGRGDWAPVPLSTARLKRILADETLGPVNSDELQYIVGCEIGDDAAKEYVAHLRRHTGAFDAGEPGDLKDIAMAMLEGCADSDHRQKGYAVGFFGTLYPYLAAGAKHVAARASKGVRHV